MLRKTCENISGWSLTRKHLKIREIGEIKSKRTDTHQYPPFSLEYVIWSFLTTKYQTLNSLVLLILIYLLLNSENIIIKTINEYGPGLKNIRHRKQKLCNAHFYRLVRRQELAWKVKLKKSPLNCWRLKGDRIIPFGLQLRNKEICKLRRYIQQHSRLFRTSLQKCGKIGKIVSGIKTESCVLRLFFWSRLLEG